MPRIPDLVHVSRLETCFVGESTMHSNICSSKIPAIRSIRKVETWEKERELGRGGFGEVVLQRNIDSKSETRFRAVKVLPKHQNLDYLEELKTIAFFSYPKVSDFFIHTLPFIKPLLQVSNGQIVSGMFCRILRLV